MNKKFRHDDVSTDVSGDINRNNCTMCSYSLEGKCYYMFECSNHALCKGCLRQNITVLEDGCCFLCVAIEEESKLQFEKKNTLPLILVDDTSAVTLGAKNSFYKYQSQYRCDTISNISHDFGEIETPTKINARGLFNSGHNDAVIACGDETPTLTVLTPNGILSTHTLAEGDIVLSGCHIKDDDYLLCIGYRCQEGYVHGVSRYKYKLHRITLDVTTLVHTTVSVFSLPILTSGLVDEPIQMFNITTQRYGVLCRRRRCHDLFLEPRYVNIIHIYTLEALLLHSDTDPYTIQSNVLWGKRLVTLDKSEGRWCYLNKIAATPAGYMCLAVAMDSVVRMYNRTGQYLFTIGADGKDYEPVTPGTLILHTVMSTRKGNIILPCSFGDIHLFTPDFTQLSPVNDFANNEDVDDDAYGDWKLLRNRFVNWDAYERFINYTVLSETRLWSIEEEHFGDNHRANKIRFYKIE